MNQSISSGPIEQHTPLLHTLQERKSLGRRLKDLHDTLRLAVPAVQRVSVALYDPESQLLKTFVHSTVGETPLDHYQAALQEAPGLQELIRSGRARIVHDMNVFANGEHEHTRNIHDRGFRSSYTFPMWMNGRCQGFVFFNADVTHCFTQPVLQTVDIHAHLITHVVMQEIHAMQTLLGALRSANDMVHFRDPETGLHLERMSRYSRMIARWLAREGRYEFSDEFIEHIFVFAPLHDVGKIGIPDDILLKPAGLTEREFRIMKTHARKGREIINAIVDNFSLHEFEDIEVLRNIAQFHHEAIDGSGYPCGLTGKNIPIEARVVAVADIFDALTSTRPYKQAWPNKRALEFLHAVAGEKVDRECVEALEHCMAEVLEVQEKFSDKAANGTE